MRTLIAIAVALFVPSVLADTTVQGANGQVCFVNPSGFMYGCHGGAPSTAGGGISKKRLEREKQKAFEQGAAAGAAAVDHAYREALDQAARDSMSAQQAESDRQAAELAAQQRDARDDRIRGDAVTSHPITKATHVCSSVGPNGERVFEQCK